MARAGSTLLGQHIGTRARHQDGFTLVPLLHLTDRAGGRGGIPRPAQQHGDDDSRNRLKTNDHGVPYAQTYCGVSTTTVTGASAAAMAASVVRTLA